MRKRCYDAQNLGGHPQNCSAALLVRLRSAQTPGLFGGEVFIGGSDDGPDQLKSTRKFESVIVFEHLADGGLRDFGEVVVLRLKLSGLRDFPAKAALDHRGGAAGKIAQAIRERTVVASDQSLATEPAVTAENNFAQKEVSQGIYAQDTDDGLRGLNVTARFGHLLVVK